MLGDKEPVDRPWPVADLVEEPRKAREQPAVRGELPVREAHAALRPLEAEHLMAQYQKSRIMCIDDYGRLVGVISLSDIVMREDGEQAADTLRQISDREARL